MSNFFASYPVVGGGGVPIYATFSAFPAATSVPAGSLAVAADSGIVYESNGTIWEAIAAPGDALSIGVPGNGLSLSSNVLSLALSSTSTVGALSAADWNTFNSKQAAGNYITALTGDGTASGPGSAALTLATVNANPGTWGTSSEVPLFTANAKGLITNIAELSIQIAESQVTNLVSDLAGKQPLLTIGNITDAGTDGIVITGGTGAIIGSGVALAQHVADSTHNGYLSSTDWSTFNSKGSGSVTTVSVAALNGFSGSVANPTTTPAITLSITAVGVLQSNGSSVTAANTTGTGNVVLSASPTLTGTISGVAATFSSTISASNLSGTNTGDVTIGTANGLSLAGQALSLQLSDATHTGALSSTDWNTFNNKGSGTVTAVSVVSTNGLAGSSSGGATPALTLSTTITGILQGNGTAISAASTTGSGSVVLATAPTMSNPVVGTQTQGDSSTKAASTAYVDVAIANAVAGVNPAIAVQAATTAASDTSGFTYNNGVSGIGATLTGTVNTAVVIDGFTFTALGQRLLVKNDTQSPSGAFNGVYYVTQVQTAILAPILTRALDYDQPSDINNTGAIPVINGTVNGTTQWVLTSSVTTVGTSPLTFTLFSKNPASYVSSTLTSAHILVGNGSNVATDVSVSGDIALTNAGVASYAGTVPLNKGGTGQTTKAPAFDALSPMTTGGDLIYGGASGTGTRLANGTAGQALISGGGTAAPVWTNSSRAINAQTGTTYTFVLADGSGAGTNPLVTASNASAQTYTVPPNSSVAFPVGTQIDIIQQGAGKVTLAQGSGVTINSASSNKAIAAQFIGVSLIKTATDTWTLIGNLIA